MAAALWAAEGAVVHSEQRQNGAISAGTEAHRPRAEEGRTAPPLVCGILAVLSMPLPALHKFLMTIMLDARSLALLAGCFGDIHISLARFRSSIWTNSCLRVSFDYACVIYATPRPLVSRALHCVICEACAHQIFCSTARAPLPAARWVCWFLYDIRS